MHIRQQNYVYFVVLEDSVNSTVYKDLCDRFPVNSYSAIQYILMAYIYKINVILMWQVKSQAECAHDRNVSPHMFFREPKLQPNLQALDNKYVCAIKPFIKKEEENIQCGGPHNHYVNAAEPTVKVAKYHTIAVLFMVNTT